MAEVKLSVRAETKSAEEALKRAQALADAIGGKQTTIKVDSKSIDGATQKIRVLQNETAKVKMDSGVFNAYIKGAISLEDALKGVQTETKKTSSVFSSLTQRFTIANLASSAITAGISKLRQALREAVSEMKEMDKELTTIKMVSGASDSEIASLREAAFQRNGRSTSDYLSAAERFTRAGYRDNIKELTDLSLVTQNVGGVTEDVASKFILAADAAWKLRGNTEALTAILDGMTAVSDQNATDIGKLAEGITVSGSAFANAGETAQSYTAMMGTVTAATQRSGSEVARGLMTILYRVRQVKGELDDGEMIEADDISNAAKALDSVGISVLNDAKELKSFSEIMGELSEKWDTLNSKEKAYLQNALAGNRRGNILFAFMDNYDVYMKQLQQYEDGAGSAAEKNAIFTQSWEAATNDLNKAWAEVVDSITRSGGILQKSTKWLAGFLHESVRAREFVTAGTADDEFNANMALAYGDSWNQDEDINHILEAAKAQIALSTATIEVIKVYEGEAEAVDQLSEAFSKAEKNIKAASEAMKSEKDDSIKSAADIFKAMNEASEKGYYGSNAFKEGAKLFFGTGDREAISKSAQEAVGAYFDGIAKGDYSNAAAELWGKFANESGEIVDSASGAVIASMRDIGDSYEWAFNKGNQSIDEFLQSMQQSTGIGADFWASMIRSLGMYSDEMDEWMQQNTEMPEPELKVQTDSAEQEVQDAVAHINAMLDTIKDKTIRVDIIQSISGSSVGAASNTVSQAASKYAYYSGLANAKGYGGRAKGKRDNYSGIALVNDEYPADGSKPELIISKSQGRAYIANGGKPALVNLRSDDIVLTASETKAAGVPAFDVGKGIIKDFFGNIGSAISSAVNASGLGVTTPKSAATTKGGGGGGGSSTPSINADESWGTLKKLVDYLLDKGEDDLKDQLKVLDDQLAELEAERKAQQEENKLEEKQLAVQNALLDLEKAQVERTVRYYNEETQQWEWMADQGAVQKAQEAYDKALKDLNEYMDDRAYEERKAEIEAQKDDLQAQFDAFEESWKAIVDAIEAPSGDITALLNALKSGGTSTMKAQSGSIADLLNNLRDGLVNAGYVFGLGNINANTSGSKTTASTVFDSGGFAFGTGIMRKGAVGGETVIGPEITRDILNPVKNARFTSFVDSLKYLVDGPGQMPTFRNPSSITNNNGGNYYVNGVKVGADMAQRPFAEVMRTIAIHANESV